MQFTILAQKASIVKGFLQNISRFFLFDKNRQKPRAALPVPLLPFEAPFFGKAGRKEKIIPRFPTFFQKFLESMFTNSHFYGILL
jgi:hypothetical protein